MISRCAILKITRYILPIVIIVSLTGCNSQQSIEEKYKAVMMRLYGPSPKQLVKDMFESPDADVRRNAIERLSQYDWARRGAYVKAYAMLTEDPDPTVRSAAVRALGRCGDVHYADKVIERLTDISAIVRQDAAVVLGSLIVPSAIKPLMQRSLGDDSVDVRIAAVRALGSYPTRDVLNTLIKCLDDEDFSVRFEAAESLRRLTGRNIGIDVDRWREVISSVSNPFKKPARPKKKSWWQRFSSRQK